MVIDLTGVDDWRKPHLMGDLKKKARCCSRFHIPSLLCLFTARCFFGLLLFLHFLLFRLRSLAIP